MALPRKHRLSQEDFPLLFRIGRRVPGRSCSLRVLVDGSEDPRLAVVVQSKAAPGAAERNRVRRVVAEEMRKLLPSMRRGVRIAIVVHSPAHRAAPENYAREAADLLKKSDIINL